MNYRTRIAAGALALALIAAQANACEPRATVGYAVTDGYTSLATYRVQPKDAEGQHMRHGAREFSGPLARFTLGMDCGAVLIYAEHVSSITTGRDEGMNTLNVELELFDLFDAMRGR